jgi:hypothetical protein
MAIIVLLGVILFLEWKWRVFYKNQIVDLVTTLHHVNSANPWKSQLLLMLKSQQSVASNPSITKTSMLYGALILEEVGETMLALAQGIDEVSAGTGSDFYEIAKLYARVSVTLTDTAKQARTQIELTQEKPTKNLISQQIAKDLLDGCTDVHVVVAGLGLACGLPGQAGYDMVTTSNLSKANPVTGMIDKDASGKWIKGPNYQPPELDTLLSPYYFGR